MGRGKWRTALVTGASSGIGHELALQAAERGADLVLVARRVDELEALAAEVRVRFGREAEVLPADLLDDGDLARVEARLADDARPVDLLVNNAGFGYWSRFHEVPAERVDGMVRLNVLAVTRLAHAALGPMLARGRGGILNVSSVSGFQPVPGGALYGATKAFVTALSEALHEEARAGGVHVTALCPGFTRTEFQRAADAPPDFVLPDAVWLDVEPVARAGLDAVTRNVALSVPSLRYRVVTTLADLMPRDVTRLVSALVTRALGRG